MAIASKRGGVRLAQERRSTRAPRARRASTRRPTCARTSAARTARPTSATRARAASGASTTAPSCAGTSTRTTTSNGSNAIIVSRDFLVAVTGSGTWRDSTPCRCPPSGPAGDPRACCWGSSRSRSRSRSDAAPGVDTRDRLSSLCGTADQLLSHDILTRIVRNELLTSHD
ncbi:uncharacterized protein LOC124541632 [Vanessa cardui]|uniref:uncharacterized protein LOC124541619 n=1 Tax=Vanessa cardui TaxID=171605 RepID=UPI001F1329A5|nr:uncharacterized protein LOC124541619 [Vanessa cardui]XP_046975513.1 uncharacterized protein LOC124541632 [Vanessa cardui]